jgi:hypothetical protein
MTVITAAALATVRLGKAYRWSISPKILLKTEGNGLIIERTHKQISATL